MIVGNVDGTIYGYDNLNRLVSVTDWNSNTTTCAYDDAVRMTTETLPSGTGIVSTYTYDPSHGRTDRHLADGLGSTMVLPGRMDSAGAVQKSYEYDVYGEVTGGSGTLPNEFDFAVQQTDGTGLQYLRARYYGPGY